MGHLCRLNIFQNHDQKTAAVSPTTPKKGGSMSYIDGLMIMYIIL